MKADRRSPADIERLPEEAIKIWPYNPLSKQHAGLYLDELNLVLRPTGVEAELFGSVELEIAGKGEWEFAIYPPDELWYPVLVCLINQFGSIHFLRDDMAVFTDSSRGVPVEVIPMRGDTALRNRAIMHYWKTSPEARQAYELGKLAHAFSKREYYRWKDEWIAGIIESL